MLDKAVRERTADREAALDILQQVTNDQTLTCQQVVLEANRRCKMIVRAETHGQSDGRKD